MTRPPVVFIPGFGGSFNLRVMLEWSGPTLNGWGFPPFTNYGRGFVANMEAAGYVEGEDLFIAFYDWRKAVQDSYRAYLMPWIDQALARSGRSQVALVGHSMGGLVARSYLQSPDYRSDVSQLITLGTPHRGASQAFYPWQGGQLRWSTLTNTVIEIYLWYLKNKYAVASDYDRLRVLRLVCPALADLLSTEDYLRLVQPPHPFKPEDNMIERNLWFDMLNQPAAMSQLFARVPVTTISSTSFETLQAIVVEDPPAATSAPPLFPDGQPVQDQPSLDGDATVLLASAQLAGATNTPPLAIRHDALADQATAEILAALDVPAGPAIAVEEPRTVLMLLGASPVVLSVTPPPAASVRDLESGRRRTVRPRQRTYQARRGAERVSLIVIENPPPGTYSVQVEGLARGSFALGAVVLDPRVGIEGISQIAGADERGLEVEDLPTARGEVAAETQLFYQVDYPGGLVQPAIRFDADTTERNLMARAEAALPETRGERSRASLKEDLPQEMLGEAVVLAQGLLTQLAQLEKQGSASST